jgi:hypothetical protein
MKQEHAKALTQYFDKKDPFEVIDKVGLLGAIKAAIIDGHDLFDPSHLKEHFESVMPEYFDNSPIVRSFMKNYDNDGTMGYHVIECLLKDGKKQLIEDFLSHNSQDILDFFSWSTNLNHGLLDNKSHNYDEVIGKSYFYLLNSIAVVDKKAVIDHIDTQLGRCNVDLVNNFSKIESKEIVEAAVSSYRSAENETLKGAKNHYERSINDDHPDFLDREYFSDIIQKCGNMDAKLALEFNIPQQDTFEIF